MRSGPDEWRSFLAVARDLHFRKASQRLFISQPALSKQIQKLEEKIGAPLFVRTRHKVVLTEIGRALVPVAQKLLQDSRDVFSLARDMVEGRAGTLRIGFGTSAISRILPKTVQRFRRTHKNVNVRLFYMTTPAQIAAVLNDKLDIGIIRLPTADPQLASKQLFRERLVAAIPRSIPYDAGNPLRWLQDRPFILLTRSGSTAFQVGDRLEEVLSNARHREPVLAVWHRAGFIPSVLHEASDMFTVINMVSVGTGVALVPSAATRIRVPGVKFHELHMPEAEWPIGMAWKKSSEKINLISKFRAMISAIASRE